MRFDERIHRFIWEATGNPHLIDTLERYFTHSLRIWYLVLDRVPGLGHAVHDQTHLLQALLDADEEPGAHDHARARARVPARDPGGVQPHVSGAGDLTTRMFIDGEWCDAASGATVDATSPATGESLGPVAEGDREDARRAIAAAGAAFPSWGRGRASSAPSSCTAWPTPASAAATSSPACSPSTRASR